jgi:uncharacterized iron-regulated membrane protein
LQGGEYNAEHLWKEGMTYLQRWISHPQSVWLRKAIFQLHLWSGIGIGLYVLVVSVTGSIVVYRNELYVAATRDPIVVTPSGPRLTDDELKAAAIRLYPEYAVLRINRGQNPDQAVSIALNGIKGPKDRLFNPYTGEDLGDTAPLGIRIVSKLLELHDDLFAGNTGRSINGFGGLLLIVLVFTGIVVWWPGIKTWRRSLVVHRKVGWRRFTWDLHSMVGFWTLGFIVLFGLSGAYLGNPELVQEWVDKIDPPTADNIGSRISDQFIYWLAYLHFGRINGIGIPCRGPGLCDQTTKLIWALAGLAPAVMFVTGALMWWNRVARKKLGRASPRV